MSDMIDIILRALKLDESNIKFVEFLISNVDKTDRYGATPLMYAAMRGYNRLAKMLIEQGFDVNATGSAPTADKALAFEGGGRLQAPK